MQNSFLFKLLPGMLKFRQISGIRHSQFQIAVILMIKGMLYCVIQ